MKRINRHTSWDNLPGDCWGVVVSFFESGKTFLNVMLSIKGLFDFLQKCCPSNCRNSLWTMVRFPHEKDCGSYWYVRRLSTTTSRLTVSKHIEQKKYENMWKILFDTKLISDISLFFPFLESLTIKRENHRTISYRKKVSEYSGYQRYTRFPPDKMSFQNTKMLELRKLHFYFIDGDYSGKILLFTDSLPNLEILDVEGGRRNVSLSIVINESFKKLKYLKIENIPSIYFSKRITGKKLINKKFSISPSILTPEIVSNCLISIIIRNSECPFHQFSKNDSLNPNLEKLEVWNVETSLRRENREVDLQKLPNLKTFSFSLFSPKRSFKIVWNQFSQPNLTYLKVHCVESSSNFQEFQRFPNLRQLDFDVLVKSSSQPSTSEENYSTIISSFPENIHTLKVRSSLCSVKLDFFRDTLKRLDLVLTKFEIVIDLEMLQTSNIEYLRVKNAFFGRRKKRKKKKKKKTEKVVLKPLLLRTTNSLTNKVSFRKIRNFKKLKTLVLQECECTEVLLIYKCRELKTIEFRDVYGSVELSKLKRLKSIKIVKDVTSPFKIDESSCPNIDSLSLQNCRNFNLSPCFRKNLKHLRIWNCFYKIINKTDTIRGFEFPNLEYLEVLHDCMRVSTVKHLVNLKKLRRIDYIPEGSRCSCPIKSVKGINGNVDIVLMKSIDRDKEPVYLKSISMSDFLKGLR